MALSELPSPPRPSDVGPDPSGGRRARAIAPPSPAEIFLGTWLPFILSAAWGALLLGLLVRDPRYVIPLGLLTAAWVIPIMVQRHRERRVLLGGNVARVLETWTPQLSRAPFPETMQPLMIGTAYAANGWTRAGREALARAARGPAWAAAYEQRLVLEIVLEALDGDRRFAVRRAAELAAMPLPPTSIFLRRRIAALRAGLAALARAFARVPHLDDYEVLLAGAKASPVFHWAFSYAAAVVAIDQRAPMAARHAIAGAPRWGEDSVFAEFQLEITSQIEALEAEHRHPEARSR